MSEKTAVRPTGSYAPASIRKTHRVRWIVLTGLFMAINIAFSSFGIPVPGGHLYLCDVVICSAAILMDPVSAFLVGGIGSFLGDLLFYPAPMFVSLVTHGLQALVISLIVHHGACDRKGMFRKALVGTLIGAAIMVVGYTLGKIYVYSTLEYAILKLPYEIAQGLLGVVGSLLICFKGDLIGIFKKMEVND